MESTAKPESGLDSALLEDGMMSVAEAAAFARLSEKGIRRALESGKLVSLKRGQRRLVPRRALLDWLREGLGE